MTSSNSAIHSNFNVCSFFYNKCFFSGEDQFMLWVVYSTFLTAFVYWFFGGIYTLLDWTNKPAFIRRYKIQPGTNEPVDNGRLKSVRKNYHRHY